VQNNIAKILSIAALIFLLAAGASLADDNRRHPRGRGIGYYAHKADHHYHRYHCYTPCHVPHVHHHRPVVVERHYPHQPVRYVRPNGFVFGFSVVDAAAGAAFSFGIGGR
jgi:hypothetical protein